MKTEYDIVLVDFIKSYLSQKHVYLGEFNGTQLKPVDLVYIGNIYMTTTPGFKWVAHVKINNYDYEFFNNNLIGLRRRIAEQYNFIDKQFKQKNKNEYTNKCN